MLFEFTYRSSIFELHFTAPMLWKLKQKMQEKSQYFLQWISLLSFSNFLRRHNKNYYRNISIWNLFSENYTHKKSYCINSCEISFSLLALTAVLLWKTLMVWMYISLFVETAENHLAIRKKVKKLYTYIYINLQIILNERVRYSIRFYA